MTKKQDKKKTHKNKTFEKVLAVFLNWHPVYVVKIVDANGLIYQFHSTPELFALFK